MLLVGAGCGDEGGSVSSNAGPLVDNTSWVPTDAGEEHFGPVPDDAECDLEPRDCPEYPWPENDCVSFDATSTCITAYVPECLDSFTVMAVYTRVLSNPTIGLCNWLTLTQPSLREIRAGDQVEVRMRHSELTAPVPNEDARMSFVIGDEMVLDYTVLIPSPFRFPSVIWTAPTDVPAGTPLLFHVDNHGSNEYMLIEVNILEPAENTES